MPHSPPNPAIPMVAVFVYGTLGESWPKGDNTNDLLLLAPPLQFLSRRFVFEFGACMPPMWKQFLGVMIAGTQCAPRLSLVLTFLPSSEIES